jgi:hypothetical protein
MLSFEKDQYMGTAPIITKLQSLPFQKVVHKIATTDAQPANEQGAILVMVTGGLMVRNAAARFTQGVENRAQSVADREMNDRLTNSPRR